MDLKKFLLEQTNGALTEQSATAIVDAFEAKISLAVESALTQQDDTHSTKLHQLMEAVDKDHGRKLERVVEAQDKAYAVKLKKIINKYETEINEDANTFKQDLVKSISLFMEEFIDESIPKEAILEATRNKSANAVLENLRKVLAVDSTLMNESIKGAIQDGKQQLDQIRNENAELKNTLKTLTENYEKAKSTLIIEQQCEKYKVKPDVKKFIVKTLGDKTPKFIAENFEYTLKLYNKQEERLLNNITEQAFGNRVVKADAPQVINESSKPKQQSTQSPYTQMYVDELK